MKRIFLFVITNLAVMVVLGIVMEIFGIRGILDAQGRGINFNALLIMSVVVGMSGSFISLAMSKWLAKRGVGAQIIKQPTNATESWLLETVHRHTQMARIGMPEVAIYQSPDINAFATGMNKNNALVAVSTGLLQKMDKDQAEAVLGHEITHVANGDMVTLALIQGVVNTFVFFLSRVIGVLVDRVVFKVERGYGPGYWITVIVAQIVLGILASIVVMWFSRQREFRADQGGAQLAGRDKMISALRELQRAYEPPHLPDQMKAMGISGKGRKGLARLFMSHPPLEERIAALEQYR